MVEPGEVVQEPSDRRPVAQLLEQRPRALGVRAREHPASLPLSDERGLEERVGDLGVCRRTPRRARARARCPPRRRPSRGSADGSASASGRCPNEGDRQRSPGPRENQRLIEEDDRLGDARLRVADDADEEHDLGPVDVGEARGHGQRGRLLEQRHRLHRARRYGFGPTPPCAGGEGRAAGPSAARARARARKRAARPRTVRRRRAARRPRARPRSALSSALLTPCSRNSRSVSSRPASHSSVSRVGRVFPRSIWLTYSFEKRPRRAPPGSARRNAAARHALADRRTPDPPAAPSLPRTNGGTPDGGPRRHGWRGARARRARSRPRRRRSATRRHPGVGIVALDTVPRGLGQPFALRAEKERERAARADARERLAAVGDERDPPLRHVVPRDERHAEDRARRGAQRARPGRIGATGDSDTPAPNASAVRSSVPTFPGSETCQSASTTSRAPTGRSARR